MKLVLKLTDEESAPLALPRDAITQTFGILAMRGAGKSNLAAVMAEEMWKAELPFVVIDPVGAWYGLRSSADGKEPGLPITIFGGRFGDVPLEKTGGQLVADLVVEQRLSCVLDISDFSEGDKTRFLIDFAERLYRKNSDPLHLFLEEADDYIPQKPFREQARLLRAWENVVRRGRARGLGMTMITQRSAAINKNVLTQVETLFVLRTTSPQDRKAVGLWVDYHGQSSEVLDSLPTLGQGEAWVWSPAYLKLCKQVQIRRRRTFDSGATPKSVKGHRPPATLADVDISALSEQMKATIERAQAEDPRALAAEVRRLRGELLREQEETRAYAESTKHWREKYEAEAKKKGKGGEVSLGMLKKLVERFEKVSLTVRESCGYLSKEGERLRAILEADRKEPGVVVLTQEQAKEAGWRVKPSPPTKFTIVRSEVTEGLTGPEQRILDALAWMEAIGISEPEQTAVAFLAGYSPKGGAYLNPRGRLRQEGLIEYRGGDRLALTPAGRGKANKPQAPMTPSELQARVLERLPGPEQKILRVLLDAYPKALSNEELASRAGYSPKGGAYGNPRGRLRTLGLIAYQSGEVVARPLLFLEG